MARGLPDDSNIVKDAPVYGLSDMAELAARLGSPMTYIRYGDVFMLDDFEGGFQGWSRFTYAPDTVISLSGTHTRSKGTAVHITSGTGADPCGTIVRYEPLPTGSLNGFGYAFGFGGALSDIRIGMVATIAERNWHFWVIYDHVAGQLTYRDDTGAPQVFANLKLRPAFVSFHQVKLVVNFTTHKYQRLYIDNHVYDLSAYTAQWTAAVGQEDLLSMTVYVLGTGAPTAHAYIDDAVATQNEF